MAVGSRRSSSGSGVPPRGTAATRRTPSSFAEATTSASDPRAAIGRRNVPPIAPRSAFQLNGLAEPSIATTPDAPNAAAARTIAPTLPGSCSPASTSTSGRSVTVAMTTRTSAGRARAIATTPEGCCTGLIAASTWSLTVTTRPPRFLTSLAMRASGREHVVELPVRERGELDADVAQERLVHEMLAVQQDLDGVTAAAGSSCRRVTGREARARSRKRLTIAFWRLLIRSIPPIILFSTCSLGRGAFLLPSPS